MNRKIVIAGLATLILASAADACFFNRQARTRCCSAGNQTSAIRTQWLTTTNLLGITSVNGMNPGTNGAISGAVPLQNPGGNVVKMMMNYNPGSDAFHCYLTPPGGPTQKIPLKLVRIERQLDGSYNAYGNLGVLSPSTAYSLYTEDTTLTLYSTNTVTFTTGS